MFWFQMASKSRPHRSTNAALRIASFNVQVFGRKKVSDVRVFEILVQVYGVVQQRKREEFTDLSPNRKLAKNN